MNRLGKPRYSFLILIIITLLAAVPAASAFTATQVSPPDPTVSLNPGDTISLQINGLAAGDKFRYTISSDDLQVQGNSATFSNVNMPFGFTAGTANTLLNMGGIAGPVTLDTTRLSDGVSVHLTGNPIFTNNNIRAGNYDVVITCTPAGGGTPVTMNYQVNGDVAGPVAGTQTLSLTVRNINAGHLTIEILDNGVQRFIRTFTISVPVVPTGTPPPDPGSGGDVGGAPAALAAPPALLAPPGISPTTVTIAHNKNGVALADYSIPTDPASGVSSSVDIQAGTTIVMGPGYPSAGQPVGEISITPLDPETVAATVAAGTLDQTGVFSFSGLAIECEPTGATFSGSGATLSFTLTPAQWAEALVKVNGNLAALSIQTYVPASVSPAGTVIPGHWESVPSIVDPVTHTISTQVTHFSMYALFYKVAGEPTPAPRTSVQLTTPAPTPAGTNATSLPAATPVTTRLAPLSPTPAPGIFDALWQWIHQIFGG